MSLRFVRDVEPDEIRLEVEYAAAHPSKTELLGEWLALLDWSGDIGPYASVIGTLEAAHTEFLEDLITESEYVAGLREVLDLVEAARVVYWCDSCVSGDTTWVGRHSHMRDGSIESTTAGAS